MRPPPGMHAAIVSRVKVIGKMDIAEKRLPQEGRVRIISEGREIDLRVSSMPTLLGEKLVIRVLDKSNLHVDMHQLGLRDEPLGKLVKSLRQPHGMVLVTGPTGSGKTTTLYSALDLLRNAESNILTVEDPVEYQLDMVNQIQVNEQIGLTFARALRSILRQDPDIIMVGEIRDEVTARVAVQAALTGHLVLATIHTNDAPGTIARLRDMAIEPYLIASSLNGVVAQRLARTSCPSCVTSYYPQETVLRDARLDPKKAGSFRHGTGCQQCHNSGFKGRTGIYEVMEVTDKMRRAITDDAETAEIREIHRLDGGKSLRDEGVLVALSGKTSLEETLRVTRGEDDEESAPAIAGSATPETKPDGDTGRAAA
jgi:type IV pilus assembly protein PilB